MPFYEREERMLEVLSERETMTVGEIAEALFISVPTARRDLTKLEEKLHVKAHFAQKYRPRLLSK